MEVAILALLVAQAPTGVLSGQVVERGGGGALVGVEVVAGEVAGERVVTLTVEGGRFELRLSPGSWRVQVGAPERRFVVTEEIIAGEQLDVRYVVEPGDADPYRTVVVGRRDRRIVARTRLEDREIKRIPGTFGDPFRVVGTLPGAGSVMSMSPYPVVRGTHPGATGYLVDGVPVPQLFHLLGGPAVIHPEFIDRVDFYPGAFPVRFGGYIGGIVDGVSRRSRPDERRLEAALDLTAAGGYARGALGDSGVTGTAAFRYGYPGLLLDALQSEAFLRYWDYQGRLDGAVWGGRWRLFGFGAYDEFGQRDPEELSDGDRFVRSEFGFHRLDVGWRRTLSGGRGQDSYQLTLGTSVTDGALGGFTEQQARRLSSSRLQPRAAWERRVSPQVRINSGVEVISRILDVQVPVEALVGDVTDGEVEFDQGVLPTTEALELEGGGTTVGGYVEVPAEVSNDVTVTPGIRLDVWSNRRTSQIGLDPRLAVRWQATMDTAYEARAGVFHQPPRFVVPVPGLEEIGLARGLLRSLQASAGVQTSVARGSGLGLGLELTGYYAHMDPLLFDLTVNRDNSGRLVRPEEVPLTEEERTELAAQTVRLRSTQGRSFGVEVLLRRQRKGRLFGWVSYTLSKSERSVGGRTTPFDFDRRHIVNVVAGVALPRRWEVGVRALAQSGRPDSSPTGHNDLRLDPTVRLDLRIDKRAVWRDWTLEFYVDLANATVSPEPLSAGRDSLRFVIPSIGVKGIL